LEAQISILRVRIDTSRIVPTPKEKAELLRIGGQLGHDISDCMHVVLPESYRKWVRQAGKEIPFKASGRPRTPKATISLVLRIANENTRWGYRKIVGELKKLGIRIGTTTVRSILNDRGVHPSPGKAFKKPSIPWKTFVHAHMDSMVACDFFTKRVYTLRGALTAHVLVFIHLDSRKVYCSPATYHPDGDWVTQEARNASMWLADMNVTPRFLVHDRDKKFPKAFREFWKAEGVRCILTPVRAPMANAFAETWIESFKRECLNYFVCVELAQLNLIITSWRAYYNSRRPHRGIGKNNEVLDRTFQPQTHGAVRCEQQLGGIITCYFRDAA
jgi:putative transposase